MRNEMKPFVNDELWAYAKTRPDNIYGAAIRYFNNELSKEDIAKHKYISIGKVTNIAKKELLLQSLDIECNKPLKIETLFLIATQKTNICKSMRNKARAIKRNLYISGWLKQESWLHLMKDDVDFEVLEWDIEKTEFGWNYKIKGNHLIYYND